MDVPSEPIPGSTAGDRAYAGFAYQALMAVPFCVDCGLGGGTQAVILELFEDIAIELHGSWRLLQIKSRDAHLRPWRLNDLTAEPGGGIRSLARSFDSAVAGIDVTYELFLEGPVDPRDHAAKLRTEKGRSDHDLVARLADALSMGEEPCAEFLSKFRIRPDQPSRVSIEAHNLRALGETAGFLTADQITEVHRDVVHLIQGAMSAASLGLRWPQCLFEDEEQDAVLLAEKRLDYSKLAPLVELLSAGPRLVLASAVQGGYAESSALSEKLVAGGATDEVIADAQDLRARASLAELTHLGASLSTAEGALDDTRSRLAIIANGSKALFAEEDWPAIHMWNDLLDRLPNQAAELDASRIFAADPMLLLGEICQLADLCTTDWGRSRAS